MKFFKPMRKKDTYASKIRNEDGKAVLVHIRYTNLQSLTRMDDDGGILVKLYMPHDHASRRNLAAVDQAALEAILANNKDWFSNDLTDDAIRERMRSSVTDTSFAALISAFKLPKVVQYNEKAYATFDALIAEHPPARSMWVSLVVEAQGLYFFPKRFGVRWMIREIYVSSRAPDEEEEEFVQMVIQDERHMIEEDVRAEVTAEIEKAEKYVGELKYLLERVIQHPNVDAGWNQALEKLRDRILSK